jgi:hypothetical protein
MIKQNLIITDNVFILIKGQLCARNDFIFSSQKLFNSLMYFYISQKLLIGQIPEPSFSYLPSLGNKYSYSDLVFSMEVNILLCLNFGNFDKIITHWLLSLRNKHLACS